MDQPITKPQSWWQLLSIQIGGAICLPVIMVGQLLGQKLGWLAAVLAVGLGNLFLLFVGYILASLSLNRRQSTVEQAVESLGRRGRPVIAALLMVSVLGWFAIQLNVMSLSFDRLLQIVGLPVPTVILNIGLGILISWLMCFGTKGMERLSNLTSPILLATLLYATLSAGTPIPPPLPLTFTWLSGLSIIIGANIAAVIDLPTFFQHARSKRDGQLCIVLLYGLVVPFLEMVGVFLSAMKGGGSIVDVLQQGHGKGWGLWICAFVVLSGWTTNNANLYSAMISSHSFLKKSSQTIRVLSLGMIGTLLACLDPLGNIESFLEILSIVIGAMGAVMVVRGLFTQAPGLPWISYFSWILGIAVAFTPWWTTGVPAFDAFLGTFVAQFLFTTLAQRSRRYEAINN